MQSRCHAGRGPACRPPPLLHWTPQLCHWAVGHVGPGVPPGLLTPSLNLTKLCSKGGPPCPCPCQVVLGSLDVQTEGLPLGD